MKPLSVRAYASDSDRFTDPRFIEEVREPRSVLASWQGPPRVTLAEWDEPHARGLTRREVTVYHEDIPALIAVLATAYVEAQQAVRTV